MKNKILIFISLLLLSELLFSQSNSSAVDERDNLLSRYRISGGLVSLLFEENNFDFQYPFFNIRFRSSGFSKTKSDLFKIKFAFEPGVNGLILKSNIEYEIDLFFIPYAKFGPEIRLSENLFLGVSSGVIVITYVKFTPVPFFGLNSFYLIPLSEKFFLEMEGGFHTTFVPEKLPLLFYISAGIAVN